MVLVDTNIWIHAFKNPAAPVIPVLSRLVVEKHACMSALIRAELLSGARNEADYRFLEEKLVSVPVLEEKPGLWDQAAHARFRLARSGIQESLIDLSIACIAHQNRAPLWTLDKQFVAIQKVVPFKRFHPN